MAGAKSRPMVSALVVFVVVLIAFMRIYRSVEVPRSPPPVLKEGLYRVDRVVDGDTLLLENRARIRLIGIDTPETVKPDHPVEPFGPEATEFARKRIASAGGHVRLVFDGKRKDRYDRFLAHVYIGEELLNESLVRAGLARARLEFDYSESYKERYRRAEAAARAAGRGIWSREGSRSNRAASSSVGGLPGGVASETRFVYPAFFAA
jgi:micrococcal nuclease